MIRWLPLLLLNCGVGNPPTCDYETSAGTCVVSSWVVDINDLDAIESFLGVNPQKVRFVSWDKKTPAGIYSPPGLLVVAWDVDKCKMAIAHEYAHLYQDVVMGVDKLIHDEGFREVEFSVLEILGCSLEDNYGKRNQCKEMCDRRMPTTSG